MLLSILQVTDWFNIISFSGFNAVGVACKSCYARVEGLVIRGNEQQLHSGCKSRVSGELISKAAESVPEGSGKE